MKQLRNLLKDYCNDEESYIIETLFSNFISKQLIDKYLPDFHKYSETFNEFLNDYPNIRIRDFSDDIFEHTIMDENEEMFKKALTTELLFVKDRIYKPDNIYYVSEHKFGNDVFYKALAREEQEKGEAKNILMFFRIKDSKICDVYTQLDSKKLFNDLNLDEVNYINEYELTSDRDLMFDITESNEIFNIGPQIRYLENCSFEDEEAISKFFSITKCREYNRKMSIRRKLLEMSYSKIPIEIFKLIY